jgi:hypothetical protein
VVARGEDPMGFVRGIGAGEEKHALETENP